MTYRGSVGIWIYLVNVSVAMMAKDMLKEEEELEEDKNYHIQYIARYSLPLVWHTSWYHTCIETPEKQS